MSAEFKPAKIKNLRMSLIFAMAFSVTAVVQAAPIFDTLSVPIITSEKVGAPLLRWGQSFVVENRSVLDEVILKIAINGGDGTFAVSIYSNVGSLPGAPLSTLDGSSNPHGGDFTYTPLSSFILEASTVYWVVAENLDESPTSSGYFWSQIEGDPAIGTHIGTALFKSSWEVYKEGNVPEFDEPMAMRVGASSVPEPTSAVLVTIGCVLFLCQRLKVVHTSRTR